MSVLPPPLSFFRYSFLSFSLILFFPPITKIHDGLQTDFVINVVSILSLLLFIRLEIVIVIPFFFSSAFLCTFFLSLLLLALLILFQS